MAACRHDDDGAARKRHSVVLDVIRVLESTDIFVYFDAVARMMLKHKRAGKLDID